MQACIRNQGCAARMQEDVIFQGAGLPVGVSRAAVWIDASRQRAAATDWQGCACNKEACKELARRVLASTGDGTALVMAQRCAITHTCWQQGVEKKSGMRMIVGSSPSTA